MINNLQSQGGLVSVALIVEDPVDLTAVGAALDGYTLVNHDLVVLQGQAAGAENTVFRYDSANDSLVYSDYEAVEQGAGVLRGTRFIAHSGSNAGKEFLVSNQGAFDGRRQPICQVGVHELVLVDANLKSVPVHFSDTATEVIGDVDGTNAAFQLDPAQYADVYFVSVSKNGVEESPDDYTWDPATATVTLDEVPTAGVNPDQIVIHYQARKLAAAAPAGTASFNVALPNDGTSSTSTGSFSDTPNGTYGSSWGPGEALSSIASAMAGYYYTNATASTSYAAGDISITAVDANTVTITFAGAEVWDSSGVQLTGFM